MVKESNGRIQPMVSILLKTLAEPEYIIAERLGRTMIYYINEEAEGKGEKPSATAVGEGLGSLVVAKGKVGMGWRRGGLWG